MTDTPGRHAAPEVPRPEPVLDAAKLGGLVSAAITAVGGALFLVIAGVTVDNLPTVAIAIGAAVTAVVSLAVYVVSVWQGYRARRKVTPLSSPRNDYGVPLIEVPGLSAGPRT